MKRNAKLTGFIMVYLLLAGACLAPAQETTGVNVNVGSILLLKKTERFGALVPREISLPSARFAFDWFSFPSAGAPETDQIQSGHNIIYLEDGAAPISFAHFALVVQEGPGGQVLIRSAQKPGLHSQNIYFCFPHVSKVEDINLSEGGFSFALLPGPPRDVPFDAAKATLPTPRPRDQFYPANKSVLSATDPEFQWPASKDSDTYTVQVAVIRPGLVSKRHYLIAEARQVKATSIRLSDMSPVEYESRNISPMLDIDGILDENSPDDVLGPYVGKRADAAPLISGKLYGWRVIPQSEDDFKLDFGWSDYSLYNLWIEFTVQDSQEGQPEETP